MSIGISYPFRLSIRGGAQTSETQPYDMTHINEEIEQALRTEPFERFMEYKLGSQLSEALFENIDASTIGLIKLYVKDTLNKDSRLRVSLNDVKVDIVEGSTIILHINYYFKEYNAKFSTVVTIREGDEQW